MAIHLLVAWTSPLATDLAAGVRRTAPYMAPEDAHAHATAAVIAGIAYDVDPAVLLAIGWHESRYDHAAVTVEEGGKVSCGVMTPEPIARCPSKPSLAAGYLAGAAHLRTWIDASRGNLVRALLGYAGGYRLIARCAQGPVVVTRGPRRKDVCRTPQVFLERARAISYVGARS